MDEDEFINIVKYSKCDALKMIKKGIIKDAKTVLALSLGID